MHSDDDTRADDQQDNQSLLERPVDLTSIPAHALGWTALLVVAAGVMLIGRGNWPLSPEESSIARESWALLRGNDLSAIADVHPVTVQLTSLVFLLFGDSDYTARFVPLLAGLGAILALYWSRHWFGNLPALAIAIIWTISPVMTLSGNRLDGGALLTLSMLITLVAVFSLVGNPQRGRAIALGVAFAIGLTAHPLGWIFLPITLLVSMFLVRNVRLGGQWPAALLAAGASLLLIASWVGTRPAGIIGFPRESINELWNSHLSGFGSEWSLALLVIVIEAPLALLLMIAGIVVLVVRPPWADSVHPAIVAGTLTWSIPVVTAGIFLAGSGPALYAATTLPLVMLGGLALAMLIGGIQSFDQSPGAAAVWILVCALFLIATVRFGDEIVRGPGSDPLAWLLSATVLGLLILLPLGYAVIRLTIGQRWRVVPLGVLAVAVALGAMEVRTSLLLPSTSTDRPGELLIAGSTTLSVKHLTSRLRIYSRDATVYTQDVRDPVGGRGLIIVIDREISDPWAWYFRDFPNLTVLEDLADLPGNQQVDVMITRSPNNDAFQNVLDRHVVRTYPRRYRAPNQIDSATRRDLLVSATNPLEFRSMTEFVLYRRAPRLIEIEHVDVYLHENHAVRLWGE